MGLFWWMLFVVLIVCVRPSVTKDVKAHVGTTVELPCKVDTAQCGELHSVKWYRDTSRIYVYSQFGQISRAEGDATERMSVVYAPNSTEAQLKIAPVEIQDEASYKCEITYLEVRENCDVVQIIKLQTLVVPDNVRILANDGTSLVNSSTLGPFDEGVQVELICEASGGKPIPDVTWFNGTEKMIGDFSSHKTTEGLAMGRSKIQITLTRGDLKAKYECRVDSDALDQPIISTINVDVNVKPNNISISGFENHVVQGTNVVLVCEVGGARPPADIKWFNNSIPISNTSFENSNELMPLSTKVITNPDGTYTTKSKLTLHATRFENRRTFRCFADNDVMRNQKESSLHKLLLIQVHYPPVIVIEPTNITRVEGSNKEVLIKCRCEANPSKLESVIWAKDGQNITNIDGIKYTGSTPKMPALTIMNVDRNDMGEYTCFCENSVGSAESENFAYLNVEFAPVVEVNMEPSTPVKATDTMKVTVMCNVTAGNPYELQKVRWYLNNQLLKEIPECNYSSYDSEGKGEGYGGPYCDLDPRFLSLENVGQKFAGNYSCQGNNPIGWGEISNPAELIVYYPPSPARLKYTPSKVVKEAAVALDCSVEDPGKPENVTYRWFRGAHRLLDVTTSNWTISPVRLATRSNFTCIAENTGGLSEAATVFINVSAPPAFIQTLPSYLGVPSTSDNVSLTCRVECSPLCTITWYKEGEKLDVKNNPLYDIITIIHPADTNRSDFESVQSTLKWNMDAWPNHQLDKTASILHYTCQSSSNGIGPGVNATTEIVVHYPPENLTLSSRVISVIENHKPDPVVCFGKGYPKLVYLWKRNATNEIVSESNTLALGYVNRSHSGTYTCEASNKQGSASTQFYLNVQYVPECSITRSEYLGQPALLCTAHANPQEVSFAWKLKNANETIVDAETVYQEGIKGYLILDNEVEMFRTYQCFTNNSVGESNPCEIDVAAHQEQSSQIGVPGAIPWYKSLDETIIILIAVVIGIIICAIIICIIIICVCRRRRARSKYSNPVELEEREKPDGQSPDSSNGGRAPRWPLRPGVLVHLNRYNHLMQFAGGGSEKTAPPTRLPFCSRGRNKVVARLRFLLGFRRHRFLPSGMYRSASGVTFKRFNTSTPNRPEAMIASRKRKKPGFAPHQSSVGDKGRLGGAAPTDGATDPLTNNDRGFYENLPFHGMQNAPNKSVSIIAPTMQVARFIPPPQVPPPPPTLLHPHSLTRPKPIIATSVQRHRSFHGFTQLDPRLFDAAAPDRSLISIRSAYDSPHHHPPPAATSQQMHTTPRVIGRKEMNRIAARRPTDKINVSVQTINEIDLRADNNDREKRFHSLELRKHRCYSPTFYSMRCRKHAHKRPHVYAVPKAEQVPDVFVFGAASAVQGDNRMNAPKPAPRCRNKAKAHASANTYANVRQADACVVRADVHDVEEVAPKTVKISPTTVKPDSVSPKGALYMKLHAKKTVSPDPPPPPPVPLSKEQDTLVLPNKMPLIDPPYVRRNVDNKLPKQPYRPDLSGDLDYADVDYRSYGPINYKAASIYALAKKQTNNNRLDTTEYDDLL